MVRNFIFVHRTIFTADIFIVSIYYKIILKGGREKKESCRERLMRRAVRELIWTEALLVV